MEQQTWFVSMLPNQEHDFSSMKLKQLDFSNVTKPRANYLRRYGIKAT
jgi:hypothetical protein